MDKTKDKITEKIIASLFEITVMIVSTFAFLYFISFAFLSAVPSVSATSYVPGGCCTETKDGAICQDLNFFDEALCKNPLLSTSCSNIESCQKGCCYSASEGACSLNSPKDKCLENGGNWTKSPNCQIPQCVMGCCILGEEASVTTPRECTKLSQQLEFETNFQPMDASGACQAYTGASDKGACLTPTNDYSGEFNCKFTNKGSCRSGDFRQGFLCTAPELNTVCVPSKKTTCVDSKDQIYYLDSCGNLANIYDSTRFGDESYWTTIIESTSSCTNPGKDCGNCDYISGSVCEKYREGKDTKPTYGDNVCRDLNCANGKKHGDTWCINDYTNLETGVAPVGSRWFRGVCMDGEITIEPCADFNNEICIQASSDSKTEARCIINDWRACIAANDKENYQEVEHECDKYEQCIMFNEIPGNEIYENVPGFRSNLTNQEQGSAGTIGQDANTIVPYCVPKNTPGMVFWTTQDSSSTLQNLLSGSNSSNSNNGNNNAQASTSNVYGGSLEETEAICSLGSFTCVSVRKRTCAMVDPEGTSSGDITSTQLCLGTVGLSALVDPDDVVCENWVDEYNWECNINAASPDAEENVQLTIQALNERCMRLGPCGIKSNIAGELGSNEFGNSTIQRVKISASGQSTANYNSTGYRLSESYLDSVKSSPGIIQAGSLGDLTIAIARILITGKATETATRTQTAQGAQTLINQQVSDEMNDAAGTAGVAGAVGALAALLPSLVREFGTQAGTQGVALGGQALIDAMSLSGGAIVGNAPQTATSGWSQAGYSILGAAIGMALGYAIGRMVARKHNMSPGHIEAYMNGIMSFGAFIGTAVVSIYLLAGQACTLGPWTCIVALVIAALVSVYSNCIDSSFDEREYYIAQYTCEAWEPPLKGECSSCNNDIRTCSEYRCRSLGMNCQYYNENGEPGYCASLDETWSAIITPWPEALTTGLSYSEVRETSFKVINPGNSGLIEKQEGFTFGIITDKYAQCKIDNKHTKTFDDMAVQMQTSIPAYSAQEAQNPSQGSYHKVTLSPHLGNKSSGDTLGFVEGENNFYIRCKNFAGQYNRAEFAVKINVDSGADLTPPAITGFDPPTGTYLKVGANSSQIVLWVNEPSECKYSEQNKLFNEMDGKMYCMTNPESARLGEWPCYTLLGNLTSGENKFYFKCKDQPDLDPENIVKRPNVNENPKLYNLEVCSIGLNIDSILPENQIITGKAPVSAELKVTTSGCIGGGKSKCSYRFENGDYIEFLNTNAKVHSQIFTSMPAGNNKIDIKCQDDAENYDEKQTWINVTIDNSEPLITRTYDLSRNLVVLTNEDASCYVSKNLTLGCDFLIGEGNSSLMEGTEKTHRVTWEDNALFYIKCRDIFGNENPQCAMAIKTYV